MSTITKRGFTRDQAADYTGLSVYKIAKAIRDNTLPAHKDGEKSKDIIIFREDLDAFMDSWGAV